MAPILGCVRDLCAHWKGRPIRSRKLCETRSVGPTFSDEKRRFPSLGLGPVLIGGVLPVPLRSRSLVHTQISHNSGWRARVFFKESSSSFRSRFVFRISCWSPLHAPPFFFSQFLLPFRPYLFRPCPTCPKLKWHEVEMARP